MPKNPSTGSSPKNPLIESRHWSFFIYALPFFLIAVLLLVGFGIAIIAGVKDDGGLLSKLNSRSLAVVLCCIGVYVGVILVFENVTEAFNFEAKDKGKSLKITSKSVGGIVIIISLLLVCLVAIIEINSSQTLTCGDKIWNLDKFVRPKEVFDAASWCVEKR